MRLSLNNKHNLKLLMTKQILIDSNLQAITCGINSILSTSQLSPLSNAGVRIIRIGCVNTLNLNVFQTIIKKVLDRETINSVNDISAYLRNCCLNGVLKSTIGIRRNPCLINFLNWLRLWMLNKDAKVSTRRISRTRGKG